MLPQIKVGGVQPYNFNMCLPYVSAAAGAAYSTLATTAATIYPEAATGNAFILVNTDDSSKVSLAFYNGTAWAKILSA